MVRLMIPQLGLSSCRHAYPSRRRFAMYAVAPRAATTAMTGNICFTLLLQLTSAETTGSTTLKAALCCPWASTTMVMVAK